MGMDLVYNSSSGGIHSHMILCLVLLIGVSAFFTVLVHAGYKDKKFSLSTGLLMGSLVAGVASMVLAPAFIGLWTILISLLGIGFVWCCSAPGFKKISKWVIT